MTTYSNVTETIGRTPLVRLNRIAGDTTATVLIKLESSVFIDIGTVAALPPECTPSPPI